MGNGNPAGRDYLKAFREIRQVPDRKNSLFYFIKNPPEGMTPKLVKDMTDSDLLDMHYFLTEDDDLDDDGWEEGFYIDLF